MKKFEAVLKERLQAIVGREAELFRKPSNCVRITLKSGKEYWATVKSIESDFFVIKVSYTGGGREEIAVSFGEVASFSLE